MNILRSDKQRFLHVTPLFCFPPTVAGFAFALVAAEWRRKPMSTVALQRSLWRGSREPYLWTYCRDWISTLSARRRLFVALSTPQPLKRSLPSPLSTFLLASPLVQLQFSLFILDLLLLCGSTSRIEPLCGPIKP
jgi:hypothetical protein